MRQISVCLPTTAAIDTKLRRLTGGLLLCDSPLMRSWARTTSNLRALRKRSSRESGSSPKRSSISLARSSPAAAFSFIMARRSFSDDARLSSVSFSSSFAWRENNWMRKPMLYFKRTLFHRNRRQSDRYLGSAGTKMSQQFGLKYADLNSSVYSISYLLHSVARQFLARPKHRPVILHCQMLQLGAHGLLLLWHHTERPSLNEDECVKDMSS